MKFPPFVNDLTLPAIEYQLALRNWTKTMREESPVVYNDDNNTWVVFHYNDVARVQNDYETFSSRQTVKESAHEEHEPTSIIEMDPPQHRQMRSLLTQAFSARTVAAMEPQIQQIVDELFNKALARSHIDWMAEVANPLPVIVIADMLGLPRDNWQNFKAWTDAIINKSPEAPSAAQNFSGFFVAAIQQRQQQPQQDVLSRLIAAEVEGKRLGFEELIGFCFTLFIAGNITTSNMLGNAILSFDEQPEALAQLRAHPELAESAVEEILRYMPPFRSGPNDLLLGRVATKDVTFGEQHIHKGEHIEVSRFSANFDEQQFAAPERIDITRSPNRHQSFGHGIHFCLGAPLARLELKVVFQTLVKRTHSITLSHDQKIEQVPSRLIFGPQLLPVTLQPA